jgi:hypothetical protein
VSGDGRRKGPCRAALGQKKDMERASACAKMCPSIDRRRVRGEGEEAAVQLARFSQERERERGDLIRERAPLRGAAEKVQKLSRPQGQYLAYIFLYTRLHRRPSGCESAAFLAPDLLGQPRHGKFIFWRPWNHFDHKASDPYRRHRTVHKGLPTAIRRTFQFDGALAA